MSCIFRLRRLVVPATWGGWVRWRLLWVSAGRLRQCRQLSRIQPARGALTVRTRPARHRRRPSRRVRRLLAHRARRGGADRRVRQRKGVPRRISRPRPGRLMGPARVGRALDITVVRRPLPRRASARQTAVPEKDRRHRPRRPRPRRRQMSLGRLRAVLGGPRRTVIIPRRRRTRPGR